MEHRNYDYVDCAEYIDYLERTIIEAFRKSRGLEEGESFAVLRDAYAVVMEGREDPKERY